MYSRFLDWWACVTGCKTFFLECFHHTDIIRLRDSKHYLARFEKGKNNEVQKQQLWENIKKDLIVPIYSNNVSCKYKDILGKYQKKLRILS